MKQDRPSTYYASAQRADAETIRRQARVFLGTHCAKLMHAVPTMLLVLNGQRQAIFANKACQDFFVESGAGQAEGLLGLRPGEIFSCIHAGETDGGCGTTEYCINCGAVRAVLMGLSGSSAEMHCRMLRSYQGGTQALDLAVAVDPYDLNGEQFAVLAIKDESHEIRRNVLERIFFHDLLNVAGGVRGLTEVLRGRVPDTLRPDVDLLYTSLDYLVDEIMAQKDLMAAENNELQPRPVDRDALDFLRDAVEAHKGGPAARGVRLVLAEGAEDFRLRVDPMILRRVLGNMIKNAVEASRNGQTVTLDCRVEDGRGMFSVHNEAVMARKVQLQIFNRSFSTKGPGRGLGTYSILLLTERYLEGQASFSSALETGTVFRIHLPLA